LKGNTITGLFKFPQLGEVSILVKCHCNTEYSKNLNFYTLEDVNLLLVTARSDLYFKGILDAASGTY
jgi:hypothetical protein